MQKFNPSKGYWRITPQNRFHIVKDIGEKNIVIFKKIETRKLWSQLNKVHFLRKYAKIFFLLFTIIKFVFVAFLKKIFFTYDAIFFTY